MVKNVQCINVEDEIKKLRNQIIVHDLRYAAGNPIITDTEYDKLYAKLVTLEQKHPEYEDAESPTKKIYSVLMKELKKDQHMRPMLSLEKCHTEKEILKFLNRFDEDTYTHVQDKEDGLTIALTYTDGVLIKAVTRGDGVIGEDVTHAIKVLPSVPKFVDTDKDFVVRGEAIIPFKAFENINKDGKYKSPRNLVSGSVRTLKANIARDRGVEFRAFDIMFKGNSGFNRYSDERDFLQQLGFTLSQSKQFKNTPEGKEQLVKYCLGFANSERSKRGHMLDGLVLKADRVRDRERLGETSKYPKWAIAFKFDSLDATTKITGVVWTLGKTGQVTPNAVLEPVEIDGVKIQKASLANIANIRDRDILLGDTVVVARANDVIPQVVAPVKELRTGEEKVIEQPSHCPVCDRELVMKKDLLFCINEDCSAKTERVLQHFVSRDALDIDGLGKKTIKTLYELGFIQKVEDIFTLYEKEDELKELDGFGEAKVKKMLDGVEKAKGKPMSRLIYGLGVKNIGQSVAKLISNEFKSVETMIKLADEGKLRNSLLGLQDVGEVVAASVDYLFTNQRYRELFLFFKEIGFSLNEPVQQISEQVDRKLDGKVFVITGALSESRGVIKKKIEKAGGKVSGSVSKNTAYLVLGGYDDITGEADSTSSKYKKALQLGTEIISENKLQSMLNN